MTFSVKYSMIFGGYWGMPVSVNEIKNQHPQKFVKAGHDSELNVDLYSHDNDPRFFLLFDTYGNIAGIRTGVSQYIYIKNMHYFTICLMNNQLLDLNSNIVTIVCIKT